MSLADIGQFLFPDWLKDWIRFNLLPALGLSPYQFATGLFKGILDSFVLLFLALTLHRGSVYYMNYEYALTPEIQTKVIRWAPVADIIAQRQDIPREVPLVLWYKEAGMEAVNPSLCTGIIGAYDLVQSGERPCFTPGPINDLQVTEQLLIGAQEFKKRCPDITYRTQDPELIKRCYYAYNAGVRASLTSDANNSAYVMNGFDAEHQNMLYQDVVLGTVRVQQLGAWPVHLAIQGMSRTGEDLEGVFDEQIAVNQEFGAKSSLTITFLDTVTRLYDWVTFRFSAVHVFSMAEMNMVRSGIPAGENCLVPPHSDAAPGLLPNLNPVVDAPVLTQDVHGCSYALPGLDISNFELSSLLQAPMPGQISTYTDQWHNTTIRIENEEWIVTMLHPRSYLVPEGQVVRGQAVGVMGAVGNATGPHVHYSIFSKISNGFVDPAELIPLAE
ncbi:MAG: M23 family metallopeptidase [Chloroflexota bacterium]